MKQSYVVILNEEEQGGVLMKAEPTAEFLMEHLGRSWTMLKVQPGVEMYCDDDGRAKDLRPRAIVMWKKWPRLPPVPQIIRGPIVFVMRTAKTDAKALEKMSLVVRSEFPVKAVQDQEAGQGSVH